jgi:L-fuconolactonase
VDVVDSHCHAAREWFEPVESLVNQMERNGVAQAVLIQIRGQTDNDYRFECQQRYQGRFSVVVRVDESRADTSEQLERLARQGATGVRLTPASPFELWCQAERLGLAVSCLGQHAELSAPRFADLVAALPGLTIVLEHLGSAPDADSDYPEVFRLARFNNVFMKLPGLGELCTRRMPVAQPFPFEEPVPPLLDWAFDAFGPERLMWGSDFPPVSAREGYANALRLTRRHFAKHTQAERDLMFGGVARRVFGHSH